MNAPAEGAAPTDAAGPGVDATADIAYVAVMLSGGMLRGTRHRSESGGLHLQVVGAARQPVDVFLTVAQARQWSMALAMAAASARDEEYPYTRDALADVIDRWRVRAEEASLNAASEREIDAHSEVLRFETETETITAVLDDVCRVVGR